ncbi:MAG TPA: hypothetical protein DER15_03830 [Clostridiales bacterium]|jgi:hypothetical protein|nr:hypothetical protein [Clostridiales bacterium]
MKKFILKIILCSLVFLIVIQMVTFASTLTLTLSTDRKQYEIGDKIIVTITWNEKMQAAGFKIKYDSDKVEFVSADIKDTFYNAETAGEISINWASMEETELTKMTFELKAIKTGEAKIIIQSVDDFADKNLVRPTSYEYANTGNQIITISGNTIENEKTNVISDKKDNTVANIKMPKTGIKRTIILVLIPITILAVITYVKYKSIPKFKEKK